MAHISIFICITSFSPLSVKSGSRGGGCSRASVYLLVAGPTRPIPLGMVVVLWSSGRKPQWVQVQ